MSCRFTTGAFGLADTDRRHVKLPRIGLVRTHESTRKLARHVARGTARIRSNAATGPRPGRIRWWVSISGSSRWRCSRPVRSSRARHLEIAQRELRRLQRQAARRTGPDRRARQRPSQRWRKTQARIARLHTAVANARRDGLHQLSARLVREHGTIVVEDLNVAGMLRNRRLARHIAGVGMGELRRQIEYKTTWAGSTVHLANRWYPSSKTCSGCGVVKAKLRLSERTFRCDQCGLVLDRDLRRRPQPRRTGGRGHGWHVLPELRGDAKRARGKPTSDPHLAGSGYCHGKTHTNRCGSTSARQRTHSGHAFTRFLNGRFQFGLVVGGWSANARVVARMLAVSD
jgi:putative transposase